MSAFGATKELDNLSFPSFEGSFRGRITRNDQFTSLWLEHRQTHRRWSSDIADFNSYAPNGVMVPLEKVVAKLQAAMELLASGKTGPDTPTIDVESSSEGNIMVTFVCYFISDFAPEYKFPLNLEEVDKFDVLESQLRDAREETAVLREEAAVLREKLEAVTAKNATMEQQNQQASQKITRLEQELAAMKQQRKSFFNLSTSSNPSAGNSIPWNGPTPRQLCDIVALSADNTTVTILRAGLYQIHARMVYHNTSNTYSTGMSLRVNGTEVSLAVHTTNATYYLTDEVTDLLSLQVNDRLDVLFTQGSSYNTQVNSRFWGLYVSEL